MNHIKDEILKKYLAGEIESNQEKLNILQLDRELIKTCEGRTLLRMNEMTLVVGGKNSGKSKFISYMIKQVLIETCNDGFVLPNNHDYKVIMFDSEMSQERLVEWSIKSNYEEYGYDYIKDILKDKLHIYSLKRESPENRVNYISDIFKKLKTDYPNAHFIICLDVGTCLTSDSNSSTNSGLIDNLIKSLDGSTQIVTIHHSFKDETKNGIGMGSIGTALERYCAIKLLISPTDIEKKHKVQFLGSKYEEINKENDYFFIRIEKNNEEKIQIIGVSDSLGPIIRKKGNLKVDDDTFNKVLFELLKNAISTEDKLQKNIVNNLMTRLDLKQSTIYSKLAKLKTEKVIADIDGKLTIN